MLLVLVAVLDLELDGKNVVSAFLYGDLDKDIYMHVHEGLKDLQRPILFASFLDPYMN